MKTTRHRRPGIRWGRVVLLPILVVAIAVAFMAVIYINDQKNLKSIEDRVKQLQEELQEYLNGHQNQELVQTVIASADGLALRYEYDEALAVLKQNESIQTNASIKEKIAAYQAAMDALVVYSGTINNLFFHNLITQPKIAFGKTSHDPEEYRNWNITTYEFKGIIQQLYERNYILVDMYDAYEIVDGKMIRKELKLPAGKIPFILSVDEMSYPDPKPLDGFARGMTLRNGEIVTRVQTAEGIEITTDGDIVPIMEDFIKQHPDFSYRGARGILAVTGYAGTLGFRLTNDGEIEDAKVLAAELRKRGWVFGCSSYGNQLDIYSTSIDSKKIDADLAKWDKIIKPIVGDSPLFVSPFGNMMNPETMTVLKKYGYTTFFTLDRTKDLTENTGMLVLSRISISGITMTNEKAYITETFFDVDSILDPLR